MDRSTRNGAIAAIALVMFAIIIVAAQRNDRKCPPQFDARTSDAFESVIDKLLASELTSEYEPSAGEYEQEVTSSERRDVRDMTTDEPTTKQTAAAPAETTTEVYVEEYFDYHSDYIGTFELTAYEWTGNPMYNGEYPYYGACASNKFPIGTVLYIEGLGTFTVCDRGGMADNVIDIYLGDPDECIDFGRRSAEVYYG